MQYAYNSASFLSSHFIYSERYNFPKPAEGKIIRSGKDKPLRVQIYKYRWLYLMYLQALTRPPWGERIMVKIDATTTQDIKCGI